MKKLLTLLAAVVLLSGTMGIGKASAYFVSFDPDGDGVLESVVLDGFDFTGASLTNPFGGTTNILTYQNIATGVFTEQFTLRIPSGTNSNEIVPLDSIDFTPDFFVDVNLSGKMDLLTNTVKFDGGSAIMYAGNPLYVEGEDTMVAELVYQSSLPSFLQNGIIGLFSQQLIIDITFKFSELNEDYWGAEQLSLLEEGIFFGLTQNALALNAIYYTDANYNQVSPDVATEMVLAWKHQGGNAVFATPEPGTMLLMGFGLLGMAAVGRRRKN